MPQEGKPNMGPLSEPVVDHLNNLSRSMFGYDISCKVVLPCEISYCDGHSGCCFAKLVVSGFCFAPQRCYFSSISILDTVFLIVFTNYIIYMQRLKLYVVMLDKIVLLV